MPKRLTSYRLVKKTVVGRRKNIKSRSFKRKTLRKVVRVTHKTLRKNIKPQTKGDYEKDAYYWNNANQQNILGEGGFGRVVGDVQKENVAYKLIKTIQICKTSSQEADIQNHCANTLNGVLSQLPVRTHIPKVLGYSERECGICDVDNNYSCIIKMERIPFFNNRVRAAYQLGMGAGDIKEHVLDEGILKYTLSGQVRGMFITEPLLVDLAKTYNFNLRHLCQSWGFSLCALIFIAHNDCNDLEYILSKKNGKIILNIIDFGLTNHLKEPLNIGLLFKKNFNMDAILPSPDETIVYPHFIDGFKLFAQKYPKHKINVELLISLFNTK